ncbi:response regulator [candidate division KSB1 bacterium]|nr:response regulator [candidate division KSB1 bacterium]
MGTYNILLVDDEENIIKSLNRSLRKFNFNIYSATSGSEGIAVLNEYKHEGFSLIITDQRMPGMSGLDMLHEAIQIVPDAMKIMLTGHSDMHIAIDAINTGNVDYFLQKPWDDEILHGVIERLLGRYQLVIRNKQLDALVKQQNASLKKLNEELERKVRERVDQIEFQKNDLKRLNSELQDKNNSLRELYNSLEDNFVSTIQMIVKLSEQRNPALAAHSKIVSVHATEIAKKLNFAETDIFNVQLAGLLHDVGKLSLPDTLLIKNPSAMSADETDRYINHPVYGATLIRGVERLHPIASMIYSHHEHMDGTGFPLGLQGEAIPIGARIIHVCNFCDRVLNHRPWSDPAPKTTLRGYLTQMAGTLFDNDICQIYMTILTPDELETRL